MSDIPSWVRFDEIAENYAANFQITRNPARRLVEIAALFEGVSVLEVGCGTGICTLQLAKAVGETGKILATDIASKMVAIARQSAKSGGFLNVEFKIMDGENLEVSADEFDLVLSCHALFGFPNIEATLTAWFRALRPGGQVVFSSISADFSSLPNKRVADVFSKYLKSNAPPPTKLGTKEKCTNVLSKTGFVNIEVVEEDLGFYYPDFDSVWKDINASLLKLQLDDLDEPTLNRLMSEANEALADDFNEGDLYRPNKTVLARAYKP